MKEPKRKAIVFMIVKRLAPKLFLIAALLSASGAVYAESYWLGGWGGYNFFLSCGSSAGNYYFRCPECPAGQSCPCEPCDTAPCQESADDQCAMRGRD